MLGLAEYTAVGAQLVQLGRKYDSMIAEAIEDLDISDALEYVRLRIPQYTAEYRTLLGVGLTEIAQNALTYYGDLLDIESEEYDDLVRDIVDRQYSDKYYGYTLNQRLAFNEKRLFGNATRSSRIGKIHLAGLFLSTFPFGAQTNIDKRLFLGTAAKIENDVAKEMAQKANIPLIRWTLASRHSQKDVCDDYASHVNKAVARYIEDHNINISPKGVYFRNQLPSPPHPNCQCEYQMISTTKGAVKLGPVKRTVKKIQNILRRIRGSK